MEQKQPLLEPEESPDLPLKSTRERRSVLVPLLVAYSFLVSIWLTTTLVQGGGPCHDAMTPHTKSIINVDLPHEIQRVHAYPGSKLAGPPSAEHDEAWAQLLRPLFVNVSGEELRAVDVDPGNQLRLFEGGYIASLEVYHHLHCLRRLKWHLYESRYFPNITEDAHIFEMNHMNHCIESLRMRLMCTADTSLYTLKWRGEGKRPETHSLANRTCTVWEPLEKWALPRALSNSPKLINPDKLRLLNVGMGSL